MRHMVGSVKVKKREEERNNGETEQEGEVGESVHVGKVLLGYFSSYILLWYSFW